MNGVTIRKDEPVLSKEAKALYDESWKNAVESLRKLKFDNKFLDELKDPQKLTQLIETDVWNVNRKELMGELNRIFAKKNNLPEKISEDNDVIALFKWINDNLSMKFDVPSIYKNVWAADRNTNVLTFEGGSNSTESVVYIIHEMDHLKKQFRGLSGEEEEITVSHSKSAQEIRRNYKRYSEGSAVFATTILLRTDDDALKAYYALFLMEQLATPTPEYFSSSDTKKAHLARFSEGLRYFSEMKNWNLQAFERICSESNLLPQLDKEGNLGVANPRTLSIYFIDIVKLNNGVTDIEKLKRKSSFSTEMLN